jgi:hypothetical protein
MKRLILMRETLVRLNAHQTSQIQGAALSDYLVCATNETCITQADVCGTRRTCIGVSEGCGGDPSVQGNCASTWVTACP